MIQSRNDVSLVSLYFPKQKYRTQGELRTSCQSCESLWCNGPNLKFAGICLLRKPPKEFSPSSTSFPSSMDMSRPFKKRQHLTFLTEPPDPIWIRVWRLLYFARPFLVPDDLGHVSGIAREHADTDCEQDHWSVRDPQTQDSDRGRELPRISAQPHRHHVQVGVVYFRTQQRADCHWIQRSSEQYKAVYARRKSGSIVIVHKTTTSRDSNWTMRVNPEQSAQWRTIQRRPRHPKR